MIEDSRRANRRDENRPCVIEAKSDGTGPEPIQVVDGGLR